MKNLKITCLTINTEERYSDFLNNHPSALFNHSIAYRNFLRLTLLDSEDKYLLAMQGEEIVGVLPLFIKHLPSNKTLINSLPFFGSHGGVLVSNKINDSVGIEKLLMDKLMEISKEKNAISLTVIDNPVLSKHSFYEAYFNKPASDKRIGQITNIKVQNKDNIPEELMSIFHSKTRNMVRKSLKPEFSLCIDNSENGFNLLNKYHTENMQEIGGKAKTTAVFNNIKAIFREGIDYNIYIAKKGTEIAAVLLLFYYKEYCEYFTPAINKKYKADQPLSFLIFHAMQEAVQRGCSYWNWGGTWVSQTGVHLFKKRWGAVDHIYTYHNQIFDMKYINQFGDEIMNSSYFYLYPAHKT